MGVRVGQKTVGEYDDEAVESLMTSDHYVAVVDDTTFTDGVCRGIWCNTAGTADLTRPDDTEVTGISLVAGFNPFRCTKVVLGTAAGLFALY